MPKTVKAKAEKAKEVVSKYPEIDEIKQDIDSLRTNVVELTRHVKSAGEKQAAELSEKAANGISSLRTRGIEEAKKVEKQVQANPGKSVATAFACGLLASLLLRRRG